MKHLQNIPLIGIPSFNESRAKSEHFRAELARLDLETKEEKLCEVEKVEREAFSLARSVRDAVNSIPDRVANQFAAETDPVVIHQALSEELRKALERLTYYILRFVLKIILMCLLTQG